jgi:DNA-binding transcriptional LysR family regulator
VIVRAALAPYDGGMNPEWLRYYVILSESRSFHEAAERLHLTPQALSKAVAGLEAQFQLTLIERDHRIRGLTPAGKALLEEARTILAQIDNAQRRMRTWAAAEPRGAVRIAGDGLWHHYLMADLLKQVLDAHPEVRPQVHEMLPDDVERWVASGEVDLGLLLRAPRRDDLAFWEGLSTPYVIVGRPQPKADWRELSYIVPRIFGRELAEPLDGWPENRFKRRIAVEVELLETAIQFCEAGLGVAFLPELALRERIARGTLAVVAEAPVTFQDQLYVVWRQGVQPTPAAQAVLDALGVR